MAQSVLNGKLERMAEIDREYDHSENKSTLFEEARTHIKYMTIVGSNVQLNSIALVCKLLEYNYTFRDAIDLRAIERNADNHSMLEIERSYAKSIDNAIAHAEDILVETLKEENARIGLNENYNHYRNTLSRLHGLASDTHERIGNLKLRISESENTIGE